MVKGPPQPAVSKKIGVVTGLASEAAVVRQLGGSAARISVACAGANAGRASDCARQLVKDGAEALLSFGIAGALDPALKTGDLIVANRVLVDDLDIADVWPSDPAWRDTLQIALAETRQPYHSGMLVGSSRLWRSAGDKEAIHEITEAIAVDMESGAVGSVAAELRLPFLVVRAIADTAADDLPVVVENAVKPNGTPAVGRAVAGLLRRPWDLPAVLKVKSQSQTALTRLGKLEAVASELLGGG